jgi:hypothetical protein
MGLLVACRMADSMHALTERPSTRPSLRGGLTLTVQYQCPDRPTRLVSWGSMLCWTPSPESNPLVPVPLLLGCASPRHAAPFSIFSPSCGSPAGHVAPTELFLPTPGLPIRLLHLIDPIYPISHHHQLFFANVAPMSNAGKGPLRRYYLHRPQWTAPDRSHRHSRPRRPLRRPAYLRIKPATIYFCLL